MSTRLHEAVGPTCAAVAAVLGEPVDQQDDDRHGIDLAAATPCTELELRGLVEHFVGTSAAMARLGLGEPLDPDNPWGGGEGSADGDWSARLVDNLDAIGRGWGRAETWTGEAEVGTATFPRSMLGEMALVEVAMHGWDIAAALGRTLELAPDVADAVDVAVSSTAELGRQMGAYGPEVSVPDDATGLDRALGRAGRDPGWRA